jgi:hypothetical protein
MRLVARRRFSLLAICSVALLLAPVAAIASSADDARFVSATNSARGSHGLRAYATSADLSAVARRWAAHMAAHHQLEHNPSFTSQVCCWRSLGENVGVGATEAQIQRAFMASAPHRANILSSSFTQVGIGTARGSDGKLYVDALFRQPTRTAPRATTARHTTAHQTTAHQTTGHQAAGRTVTGWHPVRITAARASRSAPRAPRFVRPPHRHNPRTLLLTRLATARRVTLLARLDPVVGAVAYVRVVRLLAGSASD